jgi:hypothetical protein
LLANQFIELSKKLESAAIYNYRRHRLRILSLGVKKVSPFALDKMLEQYHKAQEIEQDDACHGLFQSTYGLPCSHKIKELLIAEQCITLAMIHEQ